MTVLSILSSLVTLALPVVLVVLLVRRGSGRGVDGRGVDGRGVRRFFQYLVLLGLVLVVGFGTADLLARPFEDAVTSGSADLARILTFVLVGGPLLATVAAWLRRSARRDRTEIATPAWAVYLTVAGLVVLLLAMADLVGALGAASDGRLDARALTGALVWSGAWAAHVALERRTLPSSWRWAHLLLGSVIGFAATLAGTAWLTGEALRILLLDQGGDTLVSGGHALGRSAALAVVGALAWSWYWHRDLAGRPRFAAWVWYVLPVGVGGSLVTFLVASTLALHQVLVWVIGVPEAGAAAHFGATPYALGTALVAAALWWYHRAVFARGAPSTRTEAVRVHQYLIAGLSLVASAVGVVLLVMALVESFIPALTEASQGAARNSMLGAVTLLAVGGPLWWWYWRRIALDSVAVRGEEAASPTRRVYLVLSFGVSALTAVVAILVAAFTLIRAVLDGEAGASTIDALRAPLGLLVATGAVAGYHAVVARGDRAVMPATVPRSGPREIVLVGPHDDAVAHTLAHATGARVRLLVRTDGVGGPWDASAVLQAVLARPEQVVVVVARAGGEVEVVGTSA